MDGRLDAIQGELTTLRKSSQSALAEFDQAAPRGADFSNLPDGFPASASEIIRRSSEANLGRLRAYQRLEQGFRRVGQRLVRNYATFNRDGVDWGLFTMTNGIIPKPGQHFMLAGFDDTFRCMEVNGDQFYARQLFYYSDKDDEKERKSSAALQFLSRHESNPVEYFILRL